MALRCAASVAMRIAHDVTQAAFTALARNARALAQHPDVAGWLFHHSLPRGEDTAHRAAPLIAEAMSARAAKRGGSPTPKDSKSQCKRGR